jgi:hypothetical protein
LGEYGKLERLQGLERGANGLPDNCFGGCSLISGLNQHCFFVVEHLRFDYFATFGYSFL